MSDSGTARELTPQERAALVAWHLAHGEAMTTRQVAETAGMSVSCAYRLMYALARVLPVYKNGDGFWQANVMREAEA
jgi:DNA-binding IclR family transcriptional regulator